MDFKETLRPSCFHLEVFNCNEKLTGSWATKHSTKSMQSQAHIELDEKRYFSVRAELVLPAPHPRLPVLLVSRAGDSLGLMCAAGSSRHQRHSERLTRERDFECHHLCGRC